MELRCFDSTSQKLCTYRYNVFLKLMGLDKLFHHVNLIVLLENIILIYLKKCTLFEKVLNTT
jgi:hypothetical protein